MSFRVETMTSGSEAVIWCEGHIDADAIGAIDHAWTAACSAGLRPLIKVCRSATADRAVMPRLAGYAPDILDVESPFLRSWVDELRAARA